LDSNHLEDNRQTPCPSNGIASLSSSPSVSLAEANRFCRRLATTHYENFLVASIFLPRFMRQPFYNVYAFCRYADDLSDESESPAIATERLIDWRQRLHDCFAGSPSHPIFVSLYRTIHDFDLKLEPFDRLLDAFLQDQVKVRYQTFAELLGYCENSANPVGRIVLRLAGADTDQNVKLSDSICTGLQLANHWQDVAHDFARGRVYLPQMEAVEFQVDIDHLPEENQRESFLALLRFQCDRARRYLSEGKQLATHVPQWLSNDIRLFVHGGLATLDAIAQQNYDVIQKRPQVSRSRQFRLVIAAALGRLH
jgi:squalene synthase HpnC